MSNELRCPKGHRWSATVPALNGGGSTTPRCPRCGAAALFPDSDNDSTEQINAPPRAQHTPRPTDELNDITLVRPVPTPSVPEIDGTLQRPGPSTAGNRTPLPAPPVTGASTL